MAMNDRDKTAVSAAYSEQTPTIKDILAAIGSEVVNNPLPHYDEAEAPADKVMGLVRDVVPGANLYYTAMTPGEEVEAIDFVDVAPLSVMFPPVLKKALAKASKAGELTDDAKRSLAVLEDHVMRSPPGVEAPKPTLFRRYLSNITPVDLAVDREMRAMGKVPDASVFGVRDYNQWINYLNKTGADTDELVDKFGDIIEAAGPESEAFRRDRIIHNNRRERRQAAADLLRTNHDPENLNMFEYFKSMPKLETFEDKQALVRLRDRVNDTGDPQLMRDFEKTYNRLVSTQDIK